MISHLKLPLALALTGAAILSPRPASAEIVFFSTGRTLSVKGHRADGNSVVLTLRSGGEIICEQAVVSRIEPDEVPYPDPEPIETAETFSSASVPFADIIDRAAAEHGLDARYVKALIQVESAYQERARSRKGAMGLMQLMPATARRYAVADPYEPRVNIEAGVTHLKSLLDRFESWPLALAAYNAGEAAVRRFGGVPPYPETREYVRNILGLIGR